MTLSTLSELQAQFDALSARIAALDRDIALETDQERRQVAREKREALALERQQIAADMVGQGGAHPEAAHIEQRVAHVETAVKRHDGEIAAILRHIDPPAVVLAWRGLAVFVFVVGLLLFAVKETRDVLFGILWVGVFMEAVLLVTAAAFWRISQLVAERPPGGDR